MLERVLWPEVISYTRGWGELGQILGLKSLDLLGLVSGGLSCVDPKLEVPAAGELLIFLDSAFKSVRGKPERIDWMLVSQGEGQNEYLVYLPADIPGKMLAMASVHRIAVMRVEDQIYIFIRVFARVFAEA